MPNNNWISLSGDVWSSAHSWSLNHVPTTDEVAVFASGFSNQDITINENVVCSGIVISGSYTANQSANGYGYYLDGDMIDDGTGTRNFGSGIIMNGNSATLHIGSTVGTVTASVCTLTMNGTTGMIIDIDKTIGNYNGFGFFKFVLGANAVVTISGDTYFTAGTTDGTPSLVLGDNSILNVNQSFFIYARSAQTVASFGVGSILRGSANISFNNYGYTYITFTIPAITYTGTGSIILNFAGFSNNVNSKMIIAGDINTGNAALTIYDSWGYLLPTITINDGVTITCGTFTYGRSIMYFGASIINCTSAVPANPNETTIYLQTSTWNCSGNLSLPTTNPINPGTSVINCVGTANRNLTFNDKSVYDLTINTASGTVTTFVDSPRISGDLIVNEGSTNLSNLSYSGYGDIIFNGNGSHIIGSGITLVNEGTLEFANTLGNITSAGCVLGFADDGYINVGSKDITLSRLILASGHSYRFRST